MEREIDNKKLKILLEEELEKDLMLESNNFFNIIIYILFINSILYRNLKKL